MVKLYKKSEENIYYWETWEKDKITGIVHWGTVGETGKKKEIKSKIFNDFKRIIRKEIDVKLLEGYNQIDDDEHVTLLIEYNIDGMGTSEDMEKRHRLENKMDELLGWTGLGHCDGGSIGSGTMEVSCIVIDFEIAKKVIVKYLKETEFANYTKIFAYE